MEYRILPCLLTVVFLVACSGASGGDPDTYTGSDVDSDTVVSDPGVSLDTAVRDDTPVDIGVDDDGSAHDVNHPDVDQDVPDGQDDDTVDTLEDIDEIVDDTVEDMIGDVPGDTVTDGLGDDVIGCVLNGDCDDFNPCTVDRCQDGNCLNTAVEPCAYESCTDNVDNNKDGFVDCDDPQCVEHSTCAQLSTGEICGKPYLINEGVAVGAADAGSTWDYSGDTSASNNHYSGLCFQDPDMPDEAYRLDVAEPVKVSATYDFTARDPVNGPFPLLMVFRDSCFGENLMACVDETESASMFESVLQPGVYYFVVTGMSYYVPDWGPYVFSVTTQAVEDSETSCTDGMDNDGDGMTDCMDTECYETVDCEEVLVLDHLECGETWSGTFLNVDESHFFTFKVSSRRNIGVHWSFPDDGQDFGYVNFYEAMTDPPVHDELWGTGKTVWHAGNDAGFKADGNTLYVVMFELSRLEFGNYTMTLLCADGPEDDCVNGLDDDVDSYADCEDSDCFDNQVCNGGHSGDDCENAIPVNDGQPIGVADLGESGLSFDFLNTTATKVNDLSASCAAASSQGPDVVYSFVLEDAVEFSAFVEFREVFDVPALYLFSGQCTAAGLHDCGSGIMGWIGYGDVLDPGTWYLVVDSGGTSLGGVPFQGPFELSLYFSEPSEPEDCANGIDEDEDGRTDCEDPECFRNASCTGGHPGESCQDPFVVNDNNPLPDGFGQWYFNTTIDRTDDIGESCAPVSVDGPDAVHTFSLSEQKTVTISVMFDDGFTPAMILYGSTCQTGDIVECLVADWNTAVLSDKVLPAGQYHIVIDSGDSLFGTPEANNYSLWVTTIVEQCANTIDDDGDGLTDCDDPACELECALDG